jgi:hypothetical protein
VSVEVDRYAPRDGATLRIRLRAAIREVETVANLAASANQVSAVSEIDNALVDLREALARVLA